MLSPVSVAMLRVVEQSPTLQEEIEVVYSGDTSINYSARTGVSISCGVGFLSGVKAGMMAFATDDDREFGPVLCFGSAEGLESFEDQGSFLLSDDVELAL